MSYNISSWKTKELTELSIPLTALQERKDYLDAPRLDIATGALTFYGCGEVFKLQGAIEGGWLRVTHIENWGEASGAMQEYLNKHVLPHSTGTLVAVCIWEGGDSITRLIVKDGTVTEEPIDL